MPIVIACKKLVISPLISCSMHIPKFANLPPHHWYGTEPARARVCLQSLASREGRGESSSMSISQYYEPLAGINVVNYLAKKILTLWMTTKQLDCPKLFPLYRIELKSASDRENNNQQKLKT